MMGPSHQWTQLTSVPQYIQISRQIPMLTKAILSRPHQAFLRERYGPFDAKALQRFVILVDLMIDVLMDATPMRNP